MKNIGHNSSINQDTTNKLKQYIESIEGYEADKKQISESIKEIFDEAKSAGFDIKIRCLSPTHTGKGLIFNFREDILSSSENQSKKNLYVHKSKIQEMGYLCNLVYNCICPFTITSIKLSKICRSEGLEYVVFGGKNG